MGEKNKKKKNIETLKNIFLQGKKMYFPLKNAQNTAKTY